MEPLYYGYCKKEAEDGKKDCPCKCNEKEDKKWLQCLSGKYNGKKEYRTVLNMCQYNCWKCLFDNMEPLHYGYCKKEAEDGKKDCPCKCYEKEDKKWLQCLSGKYNGEKEYRTVLNMCQYKCWKCRFDYMEPLYYGYCKKEAEDGKKDCPCKCNEKEDKKWLQCLSGKYNGEKEYRTVLNMCQYDCWKCRFDYME